MDQGYGGGIRDDGSGHLRSSADSGVDAMKLGDRVILSLATGPAAGRVIGVSLGVDLIDVVLDDGRRLTAVAPCFVLGKSRAP